MKATGTKKPYINLFSNASHDVTGSCHAVHFKKNIILLDCGLIQGMGDVYSTYQANRGQLKKLRPKTVDGCVVSHQNIDHVGMCPYLYAKGFRGNTYIPEGLGQIVRLLLEDSLHIMQSDCLKMQNKGHKVSPFYSQEDIEIMLAHTIEVPYHKKINITNDIWFEYISAGHLIHSGSIYLTLREGSVLKKIYYTGDIGPATNQFYVEPRETPKRFNIGLFENTYNSPIRPNNPKDRGTDLAKIEAVVRDYKRVLIPSFALMRSQIILTELYNLWEQGKLPKDIRVYFDTPLGIKISNIFEGGERWEKVWAWSNLIKITDYASSQAVQMKNEKCIVVSSAGMCSAGRILSWLKSSLPFPSTHVLFIGYCPSTGTAADIKSMQKEITIDGEIVRNLANYTELRSFSSHADYNGLLDFYSSLDFDKCYLVHGAQGFKPEFSNILQDRLHNEAKSSKVICTQAGQKIYL